MAIFDLYAIFDDKTSLVSAPTTLTSVSSYDTGLPGVPNPQAPPYPTGGVAVTIGGPLLHDIGRGLKFDLISEITTTCIGATATIQAQIVCDSAANLTTAPQILLQTDLIPVAQLVTGYRFPFGPVPAKIPKQFLGMRYVIATAVLTAGNVSSRLTMLHSTGDHGAYIGS